MIGILSAFQVYAAQLIWPASEPFPNVDTGFVFAAGAIGVQLLKAADWQNNPTIALLADVNAQPPLGIEGVEATDKGKYRAGKLAFGALGIGGLKLKLHRGCIGKLFESSDGVLDAEEIYALAKEMA
mgnify:CR=1 FL=1